MESSFALTFVRNVVFLRRHRERHTILPKCTGCRPCLRRPAPALRTLVCSAGDSAGGEPPRSDRDRGSRPTGPVRIVGLVEWRMSIDGSTVETIRGIRCFGTGDFVRVVYPKDTPHPAEGCHAMLFGQFMQDTSGEEVFVAEKARIFPGASRFIERLKSRAAGGNSTGLTGSHRKSRGLLWVNDRVYDVEDFEIALKEAEKSNRDEPKESSADQTLDTRARPGDEPEEESGASQRDTREEPEGHGLHAREERAQRPMLTGADMGDSPSVTQPSDSASRAEAGLTRPMDRTTLEGKIDKIIYKNLETRYVVCTLTTGEKFTGRFADGIDLLLAQGVHVRLRGVWVNQPIYGMQFQADKIRETDIVLDSEDDKDRASLAALKSYLASGLLKGVGVKFAERIIERFGERTLEVLDSDPVNRLMEVDGIGRRRAEQIAVAWNAQHFLRKLMLFLKPFGIGPALCNRIARSYGDDALLVEHIKRNPYRLVESVKGVGFTTADRIAAGVGIDPDAVERYAAGLIHILRQAENFEGHSYLTIEDAFGRVLKLLFGNMTTIETPSAIDRRERFRQGIEALKDREALVITGDKEPRLYTPEMDKAERGIVEHLHRLFFASGGGHTEIVGSAVVGRSDTRERVITWINERFPTLTSAQRDAVCIAAERPIMILTGGPGVGKTHTAAAIIQMWQDLLGIKEIMLTAPTGRAANRLTAAAGSREDLQGITIHRCLECDRKGRFLRDERNPLAAQAIIVDECSMIDAQLAHAFFRAIPFGARLVLIGDADQLPSVGPGRVFADLFDSQIFPTVYLQDIFRQAMKSTIVRVAHEIRNGRFPFMPRVTLPEQVPIEAEQSDLVFLEAPDPETGAKFLIELCCGKDTDTDETPTPLVPFDPVREIQVLSPGYRGEIGIRNLNIEIQKRLNPQRTPLSSQLRSSEVLLRIGDRVVQTVNNYDKGVFNGDIGMIMHIPDPDATENEDGQGNPPLLVDFGNAEEWVPYEYPSEAIDQLQLAWALSVHKAQGGGYPCVVVPIFTTHSILLTRNLLYTAITRAQELCVVIGSYRAISMAVRNESGKKRNTSLVQRLEQIL